MTAVIHHVSLDPVNDILARFVIIEGCSAAIDNDTKNSAQARHNGRLIKREIEELRILMLAVVARNKADEHEATVARRLAEISE